MRPIESTIYSTTPTPTVQAAAKLWAYWSQAAEPFRPHVQAMTMLVPVATMWRVRPSAGRAYAQVATHRFCHMRGIADLPETAWTWVQSSRAQSRCARLKNGGLRVASPEPSNITGVMLLAHELCHAALEWHAPGSLADTERTETFAIAGEVFTCQWLMSSNCPEHHNLALAQALTGWTREREHEFGTRHVALSRFEWLMWAATQCAKPHNDLVVLVESAWQRAHADCGLNAEAGYWASHPLICHKPGTALVYLNAWQKAKHRRKPLSTHREAAYAA